MVAEEATRGHPRGEGSAEAKCGPVGVLNGKSIWESLKIKERKELGLKMWKKYKRVDQHFCIRLVVT